MQRLTAHLREVDETYTEHMAHAASFAWTLLCTALACAVHALLPFLLVNTASRRVQDIHQRMRERQAQADRKRAGAQEPAVAGAAGGAAGGKEDSAPGEYAPS